MARAIAFISTFEGAPSKLRFGGGFPWWNASVRWGDASLLLATLGSVRREKAYSSRLTRIRDDKGFGAVMAGLKPWPSTVLLNFPDTNRAFGGVHSPTLTS